ncbi:hypothetical protein K7432_015113 [Basidiobolus ranarum]|uniref:2-hydroxyacyl-CoA lyase 1 n=1 Tax=Basidiobolus ranarum TaxID=34480 RepID=A0ABR2WGJ9_9FUNG
MSVLEKKPTGAKLIAECLNEQGVTVVFGIVGIPVVEVAEAFSEVGIKFVGFRNEQSASYAAGAWGFLTGRPGVCLTVSGPGVIHGLAGLGNAQVNCWPMVLISGSNDTTQQDMGGFQEFRQVEACRQYTKYSARPGSIEQIPFVVEKAFRTAMYGRPGPCYIDLPGDYIQGTVSKKVVIHHKVPEAPKYQADNSDIERAIQVLKAAKNPLVIVGKGAAYARSEREINQFIESIGLPFLPTPMGKGVVSDTHPLCVAAARSKALAKADAILLLGARLNWILHFGMSPRIHKDCKILQVDICPEEISNNRETLPLVGDISLVSLSKGIESQDPS